MPNKLPKTYGDLPQTAAQPMSYDRITHCPETHVDLDTVDIRKHVETLWGLRTDRSLLSPEGRSRRDLLLHEAQARDTELGITHSDSD